MQSEADRGVRPDPKHRKAFDLEFPLDESWPQVLTLQERIEALSTQPDITSDSVLAAKRMARWQSTLTSFDTPPKPVLDTWMVAEGLAPETFERALGLDVSASGPPPAWVKRTKAWCRHTGNSFSNTFRKAASYLDTPEIGEFLRPYIDAAATQAVETLARHGFSGPEPLGNHLISLQIDGFLTRAYVQVVRVLVTDFHVQRMTGALPQKNTAESYAAWLLMLKTPAYRARILGDFPVMARRLDRMSEQWIASSRTLTARLYNDWSLLADTLGFEGSSRVSIIRSNEGDTHKDGLSVALIKLSCGTKLVYKPRAVEVEHQIQGFFAAANTLGETDFKAWKVLPRDGYGWIEFLTPEPCESHEEVEAHYRRVGHLLAAMHMIGGTDLHYENLIAVGAWPVAIDYETIFSPPLRIQDDIYTEFLPILRDSVLSSGLIPAGQDEDAAFAAGLGDGDKGGKINYSMVSGADSGDIRVERFEGEGELAQNVPVFDGKHMRAADYVAQILQGFEAAYVSLAKGYRRGALDAALSILAHTEIRVLLRHTQTYASILQEATHPQLLRDGLETDLHFFQLIRPIFISPFVKTIFIAELLDLQNGDVPWFGAEPKSAAVIDARAQTFSGVLEADGFGHARARMQAMGADDMHFQMELITAAFFTQEHEMISVLTAEAKAEAYRIRPRPDLPKPQGDVDAQLLSAANNVARVLKSGVASKGALHIWVSMVSGRGPGLVGPELDNGLAGLALFFAELDAANGGQTRFTTELCETFMKVSDTVLPDIEAIGGFDGLGGMMWAACRLHQLGRIDASACLPAWLRRAEALIDQDTSLDIYAGVAGLGLAAMSVHAMFPNIGALDLASHCAAHLVAQEIRIDGTTSMWPTLKTSPSAENPAFTGLAHGTAGVALFLAALGTEQENSTLLQVADRALGYERWAFSPEENNWKRFDPLHPEQESTFQVSWCHGAPGAGLSRLGLLNSPAELPFLNAQALKADMAAATATLLADDNGNHTLCHGSLGNAVILKHLLAAQQALDADSVLNVRKAKLAQSIGTGDMQSDLPFGMAPPGLMTGISGMGYGLLSLRQAADMPSVLGLEILTLAKKAAS
ncbi:MAG: type 2 lantipeptide synthetase LanM [Rhodobacteraceae bacterium]|nr:type 2 lantipeptide synthetase LanM [Paracoccaceae bacterium]